MNKKYRVKKTSEIDAIFALRKSVGNAFFVIYYGLDPRLSHVRYAISIGKKYGNAVERNLMKRRLREIIRVSFMDFTPMNMVIVVKPQSKKLDFLEITSHIHSLVQQIKKKLEKSHE